MIAVAQPTRVLLRLVSGEEETHADVAEARVVGGRALRGRGAFSWGFAAPRGILLIRGDGKMKKFTSVDVALFEGGRAFTPRPGTVLGASADEVAARVMKNIDVATSTSIEDGPPVHVIDNGAYMEIADGPPVDPDEMADVGEPESAGTGERGEEEVLGANIRGGHRVYPVHRESSRDDFTEAVKQRAKAYIGPNGEILDEFDALTRLADNQTQVLATEAPFTRGVPPSAAKAILGDNASPKSGEAVVVARWDGDDVDARPITVTLGPISHARPGVTGSPAYRPYATVRWGTRTFLLDAEVDFGNGCQFTVTGSFVQVAVALDSNITTTSAPLPLTAMLSFGPCVRFQPITRTMIITGIAAAGTSPNPPTRIPPFAKSFTIWRKDAAIESGGATNQLSINIYDYALNLVMQIDRPASAGSADQSMDAIPITNDAQYFNVTNVGAAAVDVRLVWNLEL